MKTFQVSLTKSYLVTITAENERDVGKLVEFYTGDISDLSADEDKAKNKFSIEKIECVLNEAFDINETK